MKRNMFVYKDLLNSKRLEEFFNDFITRANRSKHNFTIDNKSSTNNFKLSLKKVQSDKNMSDIAHSIDINMERLLNSLNKGNKGRNISNKIISSKSLNDNNKFKDCSLRSVDKTKEILFDLDVKVKDKLNLNVDQSSSVINNNIEDVFLHDNIKENPSLKLVEIEKNKKEISFNEIVTPNIKQKNKLYESMKDPELNFSNIDNINKELMNNNQLLESINLTATAIFDFYPSRVEEIGFNKGDVLEIEMLEGVWWRGTLNGKTGLIPNNYVRIN
jgi:hypothetical protein